VLLSKLNFGPISEVIQKEFAATGDAARVLQHRTALVDDMVLSAFQKSLWLTAPSGLALLAVGGYGRRELFPHSDVDLLILTAGAFDAHHSKEALSLFLRELWDSGLRISHSVRTVPECCELHVHNVELSISLLDHRFLGGDPRVHEMLASKLPAFLRSRRHDLVRQVCRIARERHAKYRNTIFHMEPDVKEAPGGLRDYHLVRWLDRLQSANSGAPEWSIGAPERHPELDGAWRCLSRLRCFLHYQAGRDANWLTFEMQDEFVQQAFSSHADSAGCMREYFRSARAVHRAALRAMELAEGRGGSLLVLFQDWRSRLSNAEFTVSGGRVYLRTPGMLNADPEMALRLFQFTARHGIPLSADAERRLIQALPAFQEYFSTSRPLWRAVSELLSLPHTPLALDAMCETGVLAAIFPEWRRIECLVVRDFYHRFTVDEHTLQAVRHLWDLGGAAPPPRQRFAELFAEVEQPAILALALLFHDIGKGGGDGRHVQAALPLADAALERIQAPSPVRDAVRDLIASHLVLSTAMSSRDLDDPATAVALAERVGTVEQLKKLTLLTYADISAIAPGAMTPWRLEQLWRTYLCVYRELTRELDAERIETGRLPSESLPAFVEGFPKRYLRTHNEEQMRRHAELEARSRALGAAVDIRRENGVFIAEIVAQDRPGLFAAIAGALAGFGAHILKAEAFSNSRREVLDTFVFSDPSHNLELNPPEMERLRLILAKVILGRMDIRELLRGRPKPTLPSRHARVRPTVSFDADASVTSTLIEVVAEDRPGLLYDLASQISQAGCNIEVVLIDTQAHKALDVFYVTRDGRKLDGAAMADLNQKLLAVC